MNHFSRKFSKCSGLIFVGFCAISWGFVVLWSMRGDSDYIGDFLINQEIYSVPVDSVEGKLTNVMKLGRAVMKSSSVTIVGVGKNIEDRLRYTLQQVEILSMQFNTSQVIFAEGDSEDKSGDMLRSWATVDPQHRHVISVRGFNLTETVGAFVNIKLPREGRIAMARNAVIKEMHSRKRTDFIINLDMDILGWDLQGIQDSFGRVESWDAICAHGILLHGIYRDTYALRVMDLNNNHHLSGEDHLSYNISKKQKILNRAKFLVNFIQPPE